MHMASIVVDVEIFAGSVAGSLLLAKSAVNFKFISGFHWELICCTVCHIVLKDFLVRVSFLIIGYVIKYIYIYIYLYIYIYIYSPLSTPYWEYVPAALIILVENGRKTAILLLGAIISGTIYRPAKFVIATGLAVTRTIWMEQVKNNVRIRVRVGSDAWTAQVGFAIASEKIRCRICYSGAEKSTKTVHSAGL